MSEVIRRSGVNRVIRNATRGQSAKTAIGSISPGCEIFGLTKGQFSKIDILTHILDEVGPAHICVGTWTAAKADIDQAEKYLRNASILSWRMIVDRSFPNRQPGYLEKVLSVFGPESIRLARFHAKFLLIKNGDFSIVVRTSMNLNRNDRIESFEISDSNELYSYFSEIMEHHFSEPFGDNHNLFKSFDLPDNAQQAFDLDDISTLEL